MQNLWRFIGIFFLESQYLERILENFRRDNKLIQKTLFFVFVIVLAFIPGGFLMSFILLLIYYGTPILKSIFKEAIQEEYQNQEICNAISQLKDFTNQSDQMNSYTNDTLEELK